MISYTRIASQFLIILQLLPRTMSNCHTMDQLFWVPQSLSERICIQKITHDHMGPTNINGPIIQRNMRLEKKSYDIVYICHI